MFWKRSGVDPEVVENLRRQVEGLLYDIEDLKGRFQRLMWRVAKLAPDGNPPSPQAPANSDASYRLDPVSQRILNLRAMRHVPSRIPTAAEQAGAVKLKED